MRSAILKFVGAKFQLNIDEGKVRTYMPISLDLQE